MLRDGTTNWWSWAQWLAISGSLINKRIFLFIQRMYEYEFEWSLDCHLDIGHLEDRTYSNGFAVSRARNDLCYETINDTIWLLNGNRRAQRWWCQWAARTRACSLRTTMTMRHSKNNAWVHTESSLDPIGSPQNMAERSVFSSSPLEQVLQVYDSISALWSSLQRIETVLKRFGSNIIFSNGMQDPWSRGG